MPILFRIISIILFSFSDYLWVKPLKEIPNYLIITVRSFLSSILFGIFTLILLNFYPDFAIENNFIIPNYNQIEIWIWVKIVLLCLFGFLGLYFFTKSLQQSKFTITTALSSYHYIFSYIAAAWLYKFQINSIQIAIFLIILLVIVLSNGFKNYFENPKTLFFILLTQFFWGTAFVFYPLAVEKIGVLPFSMIMEISVFFASIFINIYLNHKFFYVNCLHQKYLSRIILMAFIVFFACLFVNLSFVKMHILLIIFLGILEKGIRFFYGYFILHDKLNSNELIVVSLLILGGILINLA